ncbi:MAG: hypothetical protein AABZ74_05295 [Cyanobacteriota bacterium]
MRIKIFSTTQNNISSLEDQVNAWISFNTEFIIKDIKVSFDNNNILMTILHEVPTNSQGSYNSYSSSQNNSQKVHIEKQNSNAEPENSFNEVLSVFANNRKEPKPTSNHAANTNVPTNNIIGGMQDINPSNLKPGRLIQSNYTKYTKTNQKSSEDQAFDWD